jgi:hypothetical protein
MESINPESGLCIFDKIPVKYIGLFRNVYSYSHSDTYPTTANAMLRNKSGTGTKPINLEMYVIESWETRSLNIFALQTLVSVVQCWE